MPDVPGPDVEEGRRLLAEATDGPWAFYLGDLWCGVTADELERADAIYATGVAFSDEAEDIYERSDHVFHGDPKRPEDAALIVWLRNNAETLLDAVDEVERLRAENDLLRSDRDEIVQRTPTSSRSKFRGPSPSGPLSLLLCRVPRRTNDEHA